MSCPDKKTRPSVSTSRTRKGGRSDTLEKNMEPEAQRAEPRFVLWFEGCVPNLEVVLDKLGGPEFVADFRKDLDPISLLSEFESRPNVERERDIFHRFVKIILSARKGGHRPRKDIGSYGGRGEHAEPSINGHLDCTHVERFIFDLDIAYFEHVRSHSAIKDPRTNARGSQIEVINNADMVSCFVIEGSLYVVSGVEIVGRFEIKSPSDPELRMCDLRRTKGHANYDETKEYRLESSFHEYKGMNAKNGEQRVSVVAPSKNPRPRLGHLSSSPVHVGEEVICPDSLRGNFSHDNSLSGPQREIPSPGRAQL